MSVEFVDPDLRGLPVLPAPPAGDPVDEGIDADEYDQLPRTRFVHLLLSLLLLIALALFRDLNGLSPPHFLGDVPDTLRADDAAFQPLIDDSLRETAGDPNRLSTRYEDLPVSRTPLSRYKNIMDGDQLNAAFKLLRARNEIFIDEEYTYDPQDRRLAYDASEHHLDFLMVLSDRIGFDACLPNSANDITFTFNLDLHQPHRSLNMKHCDLGFPLNRNALYIGRSRGKDMIYLLMAPNTFINDDELDDPEDDMSADAPPPRRRVPSNLSGRHYFMLVMYMAFIFQKHFPRRDVYCHTRYPDIDHQPYRHVRDVTNIL